MSRFAIIPTILLAIGCADRNYNVADPVVGPVPPRVPNALVRAQNEEPGEIKTVKHEAKAPLPPTAVVARVNGRPILAGEVLEQYASRLEQLRSKVTGEQYRQAQEMILKQELPQLIEQKLMVEAVKAKLKKEQLEAVETQLDEFFQQHVERLKQQFQVETTADLEALLQENGMSLSTMRKAFGENQLASQYVSAKIGEDTPVTRQELLAEYRARLDEFAEPEQVKWQQLQISKTGRGKEAAALQKMDEALAELRRGESFSDVVKKHSTGPLAENGGHWDWTQPESIAHPQVRTVLRELPEGQVSEVISTDSFLQVIKITGRRPARHLPFESVQEKIRKEMTEKRREDQARQLIAELRADAVIETIFDE